jgi:hypothetical protein
MIFYFKKNNTVWASRQEKNGVNLAEAGSCDLSICF